MDLFRARWGGGGEAGEFTTQNDTFGIPLPIRYIPEMCCCGVCGGFEGVQRSELCKIGIEILACTDVYQDIKFVQHGEHSSGAYHVATWGWGGGGGGLVMGVGGWEGVGGEDVGSDVLQTYCPQCAQ